MSFLAELWLFLRVRKKYWLLPIMLAMAFFGGLVVVTKGSRVVRNIPVAPPAASKEPQPVPRAVRFNMSQDGKRMTADEFDAWMKAQGIRVAAGPSKPVTPAVPPPAPLANCVPGKDAGC